VFDPLAITLVIATNQAFKGKRKDEVTIHDTIHDAIQVEPIIIEKIVEVPVDRIVEKIVEVPVDRIIEVEKIVEVPVDRIIEVERIIEIPVEMSPKEVKSEELFDEDRFFKEKEESQVKRLTYTKNV
jgi:hypothetical protein